VQFLDCVGIVADIPGPSAEPIDEVALQVDTISLGSDIIPIVVNFEAKRPLKDDDIETRGSLSMVWPMLFSIGQVLAVYARLCVENYVVLNSCLDSSSLGFIVIYFVRPESSQCWFNLNQ